MNFARYKTTLTRACLLCLSLGVSLALAEFAAAKIRQDAFPFLNIFQPHPALGVSLKPLSQTRTRSRTGRIIEVQTNTQGFRGPSWNQKLRASQKILLLGDSQMFGYGVQFQESIAAILPEIMGSDPAVFNGAVPTWGPQEYIQIMSHWVPNLEPETVLFVANVANDWFEAHIPNSKRTTAQDGWAVRQKKETEKRTSFLGRSWLFNRSHLFFFVREIGVASSAKIPMLQNAAVLKRDIKKLRHNKGAYKSRIGKYLQQAKHVCDRWGCRVIAAALPMDVQVDSKQWSKYRSPAIDLTQTLELLSDFNDDADSLDIEHVDLVTALEPSGRNFFLPDDYHLSAHGHQAIAESFARIISANNSLATRIHK